MHDIERTLRGLSVERLITLAQNDPDRMTVEAMARSVNGLEATERPSVSEHNRSAEWERQAETLSDICAPILSISRGKYIDSLPTFVDLPEKLKALLAVDLIVETRIPWPELAEAANIGISDRLRSRINEVGDWEKDPKRFKTPNRPYTTLAQDGSRLVYLKPSAARQEITSNERGGVILDGIALAIVRPDIVQKYPFDLIGSQVGSGHVPFLHWWSGRARLSAAGTTLPIRAFGRLSAGDKLELEFLDTWNFWLLGSWFFKILNISYKIFPESRLMKRKPRFAFAEILSKT